MTLFDTFADAPGGRPIIREASQPRTLKQTHKEMITQRQRNAQLYIRPVV